MKTIILSVLFSVTISFSTLVFAQNEHHKKHHKEGKDYLFNFDALNFYSAEGTKSREDIYIEIPFSRVEFVKTTNAGGQFSSDFDLTIDVTDKNNQIVYTNTSKEEVTAKETGTEYLSNNSEVITKNLFLAPGNYTVKITLYEQNTKRTTEKQKDITVKDFTASSLTLSDIMVVSYYSEENGKKFITPDVTRNAGYLDTMHLFFYAYNNSASNNPLNVSCKITDPNKTEVYSTTITVDPTKAVGIQNQVLMTVPCEALTYGGYIVNISAASGPDTASQSSVFIYQNLDVPLDMANIDELIDELQYIAKDKELKYMRDGKTLQEKQKRFLDFWKSKDPTPLTKKNETMIAYYQRLNYANQHFSTIYSKGWRSDMGMVFIIFGVPSNIDKHPYEMDTKPYEVWDYYEINREFVFIDNSGFGDYRLTTPIWDDTRR